MLAKEGYPFILSALLALILFIIIPPVVFILLSAVLLGLFIWFFRDPARKIPVEKNIAVSAADGLVVEVSEAELDGEKYKKVAVFMNIFSVHVNRTPVGGTVESVEHIAGKFVNAAKPEASIVNERNIITFNTDAGKIKVVQVAGLVARRTVSYLKKGDTSLTGDRLGMIKFSSRVDHYFPLDFEITVKEDDKVKAGESIIARYNVNEW